MFYNAINSNIWNISSVDHCSDTVFRKHSATWLSNAKYWSHSVNLSGLSWCSGSAQPGLATLLFLSPHIWISHSFRASAHVVLLDCPTSGSFTSHRAQHKQKPGILTGNSSNTDHLTRLLYKLKSNVNLKFLLGEKWLFCLTEAVCRGLLFYFFVSKVGAYTF